jgi:AbrB family looped-hinge helix DNA binding protein
MGARRRVSFVTLRAKNQLTLPADISKAAHLSEGDPIEVCMVSEGILLVPKKIVDANQAWFWTPTWQKGEREASEDIASGRVTRFESDEEFLSSLE